MGITVQDYFAGPIFEGNVQVVDGLPNISTVVDGTMVYDRSTGFFYKAQSGKWLLASVMPQVNTIADLQAATGIESSVVYVRGYYSDGDGGEGLFYYDANDTTSTDNGGTIIVDADGKRWKRPVSGWVNVKWFGAKGDNASDDTLAIQSAIDSLELSLTDPTQARFSIPGQGGTVYFPKGAYVITSTLRIGEGIRLLGEETATRLEFAFTDTFGRGIILRWEDFNGGNDPEGYTRNVYFENLTFAARHVQSLNSLAHFLSLHFGIEITFRNVRFSGVNNVSYVLVNGIEFSKCMNINIDNAVFDNGWSAIRTSLLNGATWSLNLSKFSSLFLYGMESTPIILDNSSDVVIDNIKVEGYNNTATTNYGFNIGASSSRISVVGINVGGDKQDYGIVVDGNNNTIVGGAVSGCASSGIVINGSNNTIASVASHNNGAHGFIIQGAATNNKIIGCDATGNGMYGFYDVSSGTNSILEPVASGNTSGNWNYQAFIMDAGRVVSGVIDFAGSNYYKLGGKSHQAGTAPPTTGTYNTGDIIYNTTPSELGSAGSKYVVLGWMCVAGGSPGTWVEMRAYTGN